MNCAAFESELTALAAGEIAETERAPCLDRLRRHAVGCDECRGTTDLLDLLALPSGDRDLVSDPGAAYWDSFSSRLAARIAQDEAAPPRVAPLRSRRWRVTAAAVIALIVLPGLIGGWLWLRQQAPAAPTDLTWLMAENMNHEPSGTPVELPGELAAMLEGLSGDQAAEALGGLAGWDTGWQRQDWADPAADYDALLGGVNRWEQVLLLEDWIPASGRESLADEVGLPGVAPGTFAPFPDARGLDRDTRKELMRWLSEQVSPGAGVS